MNNKITLYKLTKQEQDIISNYQKIKLELNNKFNATWYKNKICKIYENSEVEKGEYGDEYKYWITTSINDYKIDFKLNKEYLMIYLMYNPTQRKGIQNLDYIAVNYNINELLSIKERVCK